MQKVPANTRFAGFDATGRMTALVADGLPEWPADLSTVPDDQLPVLESAFLAEFNRLADDPASDISVLRVCSARVQETRVEAKRRYDTAAAAAAQAPPVETPAPAPEPPAVEPPAMSAEDRAAELASLRAGIETPAADPAPGTTVPEGPTFTRDDLIAAVTAGAEAGARATTAAVAAAVTSAVTAASQPTGGVTVTAEPIRPTGGGYRPGNRAPLDTDGQPLPLGSLHPRLVSAVDVHRDGVDLAPGTPIRDSETLAKAMLDRFQRLGKATSVEDEQYVVASARMDLDKVPKERDLRDLPWGEARKRIRQTFAPDAPGRDPFTGKETIVASGGLPYPLEPYYPQLVISQGARPVLENLTTFVANRGGITTVLPPSLATLTTATRPGSFSDGVTNTTTTFTSATAAFSSADVGKQIVETDTQGVIPAGTLINSVTNATTVVLSAAATGSVTGVAFYLPGRNPNNLGNAVGLFTAAQDAAGTAIKYTYDVQAGAQVSFPVYGVATSLQFANLTALVNPESVEANIKLADALHARVAETQMLDILTNYSTLLTGAQTFGTARQLLGQIGHEAAFMRNMHRMDPAAVVMVGLPAWAVNNMRQDYFNTFLGVSAPDWSLSDDEINAWFENAHVVPWYYQDGPSDISQLFSTANVVAGTNTGTNTATPFTIPDYPGTGATTSFRTQVISYMWAPGVVLGLTTGELNVGLIRDSILLSQNRFRSFQEEWETPAFVGPLASMFRCKHTVAATGAYGAAATITLGVGSGL